MRKLWIAMSLTLALVTVACGGTIGQTQVTGSPAPTGTADGASPTSSIPPKDGGNAISPQATEDSRMISQAPLAETAERLTSLRITYPEGYGSVAVDQQGRRVILYWKGPIPHSIAMLAAPGSGLPAPVEIKPAPYSHGELMQETQRIAALKLGYGVGPLPDASGLLITVPSSASIDQAKKTINSPIRLEFEVGGFIHFPATINLDESGPSATPTP